jgi:uncharacterized protein (TIGR02270 family)
LDEGVFSAHHRPVVAAGTFVRPATGSVPVVAAQHAEDAAHLRHVRSVLVRAPHVKLLQLSRHDERIAAHLDGLVVAGEMGAALCAEQLDPPSAGAVFAAAASAILRGHMAGVQHMVALARAEPQSCRCGLVSAFGWVSPSLLRGITQSQLGSADAFERGVGLASCELQGVPADAALRAALQDDEPALRAQALRMAGRLGRVDLLPACVQALGDADESCRFEAACAALLLGERKQAIEPLKRWAATQQRGHPRRAQALAWLLLVLEPRHARVVLKSLCEDETDARLLIRSIGLAGDTHFVPWLLAQMEQYPARARLAGESFSLIAGLDLAFADLELRDPPEGAPAAGPNDDPNDDNVALDEDESLPWPDAAKLRAWWEQHRAGLPAGTRFFMGHPLAPEHCAAVLKTGLQRQRTLAAHHASLLRPGTPLFNTAAPAWRQQRALGLA